IYGYTSLSGLKSGISRTPFGTSCKDNRPTRKTPAGSRAGLSFATMARNYSTTAHKSKTSASVTPHII
ncbi:hypothetical protein VSS93_29665, partial [Pseudomonas syringae pv. tagetis]